jgi:hypothetical protein
MFRLKDRKYIFRFSMSLLILLLLSSCSMQELSDTIGSCCGVAPLPMVALALVVASRWSKVD